MTKRIASINSWSTSRRPALRSPISSLMTDRASTCRISS